MISVRRYTGRIGSALALCAWLACGIARGQSPDPTYLFENQPVAFTHLIRNAGSTAVGTGDPGLRSLLRTLGASLTWRAGERYVLITAADASVISFAVGDRRYDMGMLSADAAFAPFVRGGEAYLPFDDLMRALYLAPKRDGNTVVLQPQLASVDVQGSGAQAILVARAGVPLRARLVSDAPDRLVYAFDGIGSTLASSRTINAGGIKTLQITSSGSPRDVKTTVVVALAPGTHHDSPHSNFGDFEVAFGGAGGAPPLVAAAPAVPAGTAAVTPAPLQSAQPAGAPASGAPSSAPTTVTGVDVATTSDGSTVTIAVSGNATYEWHRLREPDNRFWIDIKGAQLQGGPRDETEADPLVSMRVRQNDPQTVRVALSFSGPSALTVSPSATGLEIAVGRNQVADAPHSGTGTIGTMVSANEPQTLVTPVPADMYGMNPTQDDSWKFGPHAYVPTNPRLIVIDPGHGGSDPGAQRNGVAEKDLTLDMAKRLRAILIARGWQVQMTRDTDVDVYAPNDSAHDELQARVNVANNAGARLFVSIHVNSYINSGPYGTTTYYSKPSDVALAQSLDRSMAASLGTKDDGIVKSKLYVTLHSWMPAALVETAFLSNPSDYAKLTSPDWRQKVAEAIADGIDQYTQSNPVPSGAAQ